MRTRHLLAPAFALALAACAQIPVAPAAGGTSASTDPLASLKAFTVTDLQSALADAQAQTPPDQVAANCYQALIPLVQSQSTNPLPSAAGAFSAFQKGRDVGTIAQAGIPAGLNIACAPLVIDTQQTLAKLGIIAAGGAVAAGGVIPIVMP